MVDPVREVCVGIRHMACSGKFPDSRDPLKLDTARSWNLHGAGTLWDSADRNHEKLFAERETVEESLRTALARKQGWSNRRRTLPKCSGKRVGGGVGVLPEDRVS
jgi:hypothetical protein